MSILAQEVRATQNPALGATILWRFCCGYQAAHRERGFVKLPLAFPVLPMVLHQQTRELIDGTQKASGLRAFVSKYSDSKNARQDMLLSIHERTKAFQELTWESLQMSFATRLLRLEQTGDLIPLSLTAPKSVPSTSEKLLKSAEKLGAWFSALSIHEVSTLLRIRF
jgi:hypothetical protein